MNFLLHELFCYLWFSVPGPAQGSNRKLKLRIEKVSSTNYTIENSSDEEPFIGGKSDEYVPSSDSSSSGSSDNDSDENKNDTSENANANSNENANEVSAGNKEKGKKRKRNPKEWIKNKRKLLKNSGKQYISSRGKLVPERKMGPPCKCRVQGAGLTVKLNFQKI